MLKSGAVVMGILFVVSGCGGVVGQGKDPAGIDDDDVVEVKDFAAKVYEIANTVILDTRPEATRLMADNLNLVLANNNILETISANDLEQQVTSPLTDGQLSNTCPYLTPKGGATATISCRYVVDRAVDEALLASATLQDDIEQDVERTYQAQLGTDEIRYVQGWVSEAVLSGIDVGAAHTVHMLRSLKVCDQAPTQQESAFQLGEGQGKALLESTEQDVLPTIPKSQCNTDVIAATVLAEAKKKVEDFISANAVCAGHEIADLAEAVDLAQAEENRRAGVDEGLRQAHEALRVRLVSTWQCVPCKCYIRYSGTGPTQCFITNSTAHPATLINQGVPMVPQSQCSTTPVPVGSPLVVDLGGDGIRLATERVAFDLAATGELVKIPALRDGDALLALDLDGNGQIDSGAELFGNSTSCGSERCTDGIEALGQYDENKDGVIDAKDPVYSRLRLWHDADRDGRSDPAELTALGAAEIRAIPLASRLDLSWTDGQGNSVTRSLTFQREDGARGLIQDVWFSLAFERIPNNPLTTGITSTLPR